VPLCIIFKIPDRRVVIEFSESLFTLFQSLLCLLTCGDVMCESAVIFFTVVFKKIRCDLDGENFSPLSAVARFKCERTTLFQFFPELRPYFGSIVWIYVVNGH